MKNKVSLDNYEVQFDMILQVPAAKEHFQEYLKNGLNEEPLLYLDSVDQFIKEHNVAQQRELAASIVDKFIRVGSKQEINVDSFSRSTVVACVDNTDNATLLPTHTFDPVTKIIYREMKEDTFARYVRGERFIKFAIKKGENFIKDISLDLRVEGIRQSILYQPKDFNSPCITDRDIQFGFKLIDTPSDWNTIYDHNDHQAHRSKTSFSIGGMKGIEMSKFTGYVPCDLETAFSLELSDKVSQDLNIQAKETLGKHIIVAGDNNNHPYSMICFRNTLDLGPLFSRRKFDLISTAGVDTERQCYFRFSKTSSVYSSTLPPSVKKSLVDADGLFMSAFYKVSENRTRYVHIVYVNISVPAVSDFLHYIMTIGRSKQIQKVYLTALEKRDKLVREEMMQKVLDEFITKHVPNKDASKTWDFK